MDQRHADDDRGPSTASATPSAPPQAPASSSSSASAVPYHEDESIELPDRSFHEHEDEEEEDPAPEPSGLTYDEEKARKIAIYDYSKARKQNYRGAVLLWVAFQSVGVIYGEIGTSPLYVFSSTFSSQPSWDDLTGALSIIIWSLTLIVTVKYAFIVLRADDDGQGGTFALYSLLSRYTDIVKSDPRLSGPLMARMRRCPTDELRPGARSVRRILEKSKAIQFALKVVGVVGVSFVMAEAVLMPAQSVLGAVQGIRVADPTLGNPAVIGISCALLIVLFMLQPFGTSKLGTVFAPIVTVWMLFNFCAGVYNLSMYDHTVLHAFDPSHAFLYLIRNGYGAWKSLGGLLLAFTGVEALFADLGAFSMTAIQISWFCMAYPCLLITYAGQAAYISMDKTQTAYTNPFFYTVPEGTFYFALVIALLAAIVASQAMITSTFQLLSQVMKLSYFPHIKVVHTSQRFHEQVYMPLANWLLMIGTVIVTAVYNDTTSLGQAYGVCVILVTFITTCLVTLVAILIWHIPLYLVIPVFLLFIALDGAFMTAVLTKVPDGAWLTLVLAFIISSVFILWRFGKEAQWEAESMDRLTAADLFESSSIAGPHSSSTRRASTTASQRDVAITTAGEASSSSGSNIRNRSVQPHNNNPHHHPQQPRLAATFGGHPVGTVPGLGIFFDKVGDPDVLPVSFVHFVRKFAARPTVLIFFHMRPLPVPFVDSDERFVVTATRAEPAYTIGPDGRRMSLRTSRLLPTLHSHHHHHDHHHHHHHPVIPPPQHHARYTHDSGIDGIDVADTLPPHNINRRHSSALSITPAGAAAAAAAAAPPTLLPNCYNIVLRHGYADEPTPPGLAQELVAQVELFVARTALDETSAVVALDALKQACASQTVYILGKETLRVRKKPDAAAAAAGRASSLSSMGLSTVPSGGGGGGGGGIGDEDQKVRRGSVTRSIREWSNSPWAVTRRVLLSAFLWLRDNSRTKLAEVNIDLDSVVEVGFLKEIS